VLIGQKKSVIVVSEITVKPTINDASLSRSVVSQAAQLRPEHTNRRRDVTGYSCSVILAGVLTRGIRGALLAGLGSGDVG
jgi:hypothetical protein